MRTPLATVILFLVSGLTAAAQPAREPRFVVFADAGYARTADDEGLLGSGAALSTGVGFRVSPRLTIQAVFDRIPYYRNASHLTFDGRVLYAGVEASLQSTRRQVRPFITIGVGMMNDQKVWTHKTQVGPAEFRVDRITEHHYTLSMLRSSAGLDIRVSEQASIRTSLRFHGLLDTGDDLATHIVLQPTIGVAWRWPR